MTLLSEEILTLLNRAGGKPLRRREIARKLRRDPTDPSLLASFDELTKSGRIQSIGDNGFAVAGSSTQITGVYKNRRAGGGTVKPRVAGRGVPPTIAISERDSKDAANGDTVLVELGRRSKNPTRAAEGRVIQILERADSRFVGTFRSVRGNDMVRVVGGSFRDPIPAEIANEQKPKPGDLVVVNVLVYPSMKSLGQCEVIEVLGQAGEAKADAMSVIRQFHLPDEFSPQALEEAAELDRQFVQQRIGPDRVDWTNETIVTIDPPDAYDFDDAVFVERFANGHWRVGVHIADVSHFVRPNTGIDRDARQRGTSVYLPGHVLPMLPSKLSSNLASLIEGEIRFTKTVVVHFDPDGRSTDIQFQNSAIRVSKRLNYEEVSEYFGSAAVGDDWTPEVRGLLDRMRELAAILRQRRRERGMLELSMPETQLEYDKGGRVSGAHYRLESESHRVIEEFMLTANEAVAEKLRALDVSFIRRVHPTPDPLKLEIFSNFVGSLGLQMDGSMSRFEMQRMLREAAELPIKQAVHYGFLRSMKEAVYSAEDDGHYALASDCYCHFTSPIRRYPDLVVHRMLDQWIRTGKAGFDRSELLILGEHCSFTERRAAKAERELVKIKLLDWLRDRVGEEIDGVITGVEEYGLFVQGEKIPSEGLLSVRGLPDDFYTLDRATHSLVGRRSGNRFQLGQRLRTRIARVEVEARLVDLAFVRKLQSGLVPATKRIAKKKKKRKEKAKTRPKRRRK